jgi:hypothetical protein
MLTFLTILSPGALLGGVLAMERMERQFADREAGREPSRDMRDWRRRTPLAASEADSQV